MSSVTSPTESSIRNKYFTPRILYYKDSLLAECESRQVAPYDEEVYRVRSNASTKQPVADWVADDAVVACMICKSNFTLFFRRHHCRRCGQVVCSKCAPSNNTRPIIELGINEPLLHCKQCFRLKYILLV